ncbi:uncharacterized protein V1518DRAFT_416676 [Limtongia smithiae]|uniref:uncharacterized protein n=1 Tax=Limtongia smithiae TaxID=1125753 RepID=UPI0034CFA73E
MSSNSGGSSSLSQADLLLFDGLLSGPAPSEPPAVPAQRQQQQPSLPWGAFPPPPGIPPSVIQRQQASSQLPVKPQQQGGIAFLPPPPPPPPPTRPASSGPALRVGATPTSTPITTAPATTAPPAQPDWMTLLQPLQPPKRPDTAPPNAQQLPKPTPVQVRAANYDVPRNLFATTTPPVPASSPAPPRTPISEPHPINTTAILTPAATPAAKSTASLLDDDFGDFVSSSTVPTVAAVASAPALPKPAPVRELVAVRQQAPVALAKSLASISKSPPSGILPKTVSPKQFAPVLHTTASAAHPPAQRPQLGPQPTATSPLKFGQYLTTGTNGMQQVVSATPFQNSSIKTAPTPMKTAMAMPLPSTISASTVDNNADSDFEAWPDFASSTTTSRSQTPAQATRLATSSPQPAVPPPDFLLTLFEADLFPLPLPLFNDLAPLPFPLKRRILSHPKTRQFFEGIIIGVQVAIRICAGRKRRGGKFDADREAREVARQWRSLRERIAGAGVRDLPNVDASFTLRPYAGDPVELCLVCGTGRFEQIRGCTGDAAWDPDNGGHVPCIRWWVHEKAIIEQ